MSLINGKRNSIKRGDFNNIDFNLVSDGELVYAKNIKKLYIKNDNVANLINNVMFGNTASKPSPSDMDKSLFYYDTDTNLIWLSDGTTWHQLNTSIQVSNLRNDVMHLIVKTSWGSFTNKNNFIVSKTSGSLYSNIAIPSNFSSIVSAKFVFITDSDNDINFNVNVSAASNNEYYNKYSVSDSLTMTNVTDNTIKELDLISTLTQLPLTSDMYIGINVDPNCTINALLFKWQYLVS